MSLPQHVNTVLQLSKPSLKQGLKERKWERERENAGEKKRQRNAIERENKRETDKEG